MYSLLHYFRKYSFMSYNSPYPLKIKYPPIKGDHFFILSIFKQAATTRIGMYILSSQFKHVSDWFVGFNIISCSKFPRIYYIHY